jgi:oxygen-independent coproporphyrinogen-3 oxidase
MLPVYRHLYLHVPFCARRCSYCDFSIAIRRDVPVGAYVAAVRTELALRLAGSGRPTLDTVYLGGGTPSRLGADGIAALLRVVREVADIAPGAELTLEANPEDISADVVRAWRASGVNRLSIGIQSFDDRVLAWMHRVHDGAAATRAVAAAREGGIDAFSLDLIFAVPDSLERDWGRDLEGVLSLGPQHVSLYGLTIEEGTPLGRWRARGDVTESPEERFELEYLQAHGALAAAGFEHYEVSNYALPSHRARHNSAYWRGVPYLAAGPSAHWFDGSARHWNLRAYTEWQRTLVAGVLPEGGSETLTVENRVAETVYLGLRTRDGLSVSETERRGMDRWVEAGWIEDIGTAGNPRVRCTPYGWLRLDGLAADLTARRSHS